MSKKTSAVLILKEYAANSKITTSELLRDAYSLSCSLNQTEFKDWCSLEMNGYTDNDLPDYRAEIRIETSVNDPYQGWITVQLPDFLQDTLKSTPFYQSIKEVEQLISNGGLIAVKPNNEIQSTLQKLYRVNYEFLFTVNRTSLEVILNIVRNTILEWTINLEKANIMGYDIQITRRETVETRTITSNHIYNIDNFQGILGDAKNSQVFQNLKIENITGNFETVVDELRKHNVSFDDISALKLAIDSDGEIDTSKKDYGENVKKWYGKMVNKAIDGSWQIGVAAAGNILGAALNGFYGLL